MIQTSSSNNAKDVAPHGTSRAPTEAYKRDPTYYYPDGGVVFSAEGVLFRVTHQHQTGTDVKLTDPLGISKLQASLILPLDSISPTNQNEVWRHPLNVDLPARLTDSSDMNPIMLPVTANQFRTYLFAVLGRPSDKGYLAFLTDAKHQKKHSRDLLLRYLDIADLSWQFGMTALELWAVSQLELILQSAYNLAESVWCTEDLLRLISRSLHHNDRPIRRLTLICVEYFISIWTVPVDRNHKEEVAASNLKTCVELYRDPRLRRDDPTLFGCAFSAILSLGHRSPTWTLRMTHDERATLFAAQVQLISLSHELESVGWIHRAETHAPDQAVCGNCSDGLGEAWKPSFGSCGDINSPLPLKDVTELARLPQYRKTFLLRWMSLISRREVALISGVDAHIHCEASKEYAPVAPPPGWFFSGWSGSTASGSKATCKLGQPLTYVDGRIQQVYSELAERYEGFVR